MDFYEKTLNEQLIYKGKIIDVVKQQVKLPNGKEGTREIVKHSGAVAILTYKDENTLIFVKQFRKPIDMEILEIPAGKIEEGEDKKACGERELEEETGYRAKNFEYLGKVVTSPGFTDEYIYIYKATELYKGREDIKDEDEFINLIEIDKKELKSLIKDGKIIDAKSISAIMFDYLI